MTLEATLDALDSHLHFAFQYSCSDSEEVCNSIRYGMGAGELHCNEVIFNYFNCIFTQLQVDLTWNINLQSHYYLQF
jgi:hypothetical protein